MTSEIWVFGSLPIERRRSKDDHTGYVSQTSHDLCTTTTGGGYKSPHMRAQNRKQEQVGHGTFVGQCNDSSVQPIRFAVCRRCSTHPENRVEQPLTWNHCNDLPSASGSEAPARPGVRDESVHPLLTISPSLSRHPCNIRTRTHSPFSTRPPKPLAHQSE